LNIKLTFVCVILLAAIDVIINLSLDSTDWFLFSLHAAQVSLSVLTIASLNIWPHYHSFINAAASLVINTIWAVSQVNINNTDSGSSRNERGTS